ncbi:metal-dependent transcriptional regulator [Spirochaeta cellobiosiphila]|uniref:metal-dependent transcriptional regulator n=1 Tax=Spirochaeta cellobiosiphila TaxID=504483 RepID=UPI000569D662|nr:metal-dependent transcriptional regulator [Spirochaeta cellobiosiphila]
MKSTLKLSPSLEDYLEAILALETKYRVARVKDIAEALSVQMPSVTGALKTLKKKELVNYEKNSFISLTEEGLNIAKSVKKRHVVLTNFLHKVLCYPEEEASDIACKMEHTIDPEIADRFDQLNTYLDREVFSASHFNFDKWKEQII